MPAAINEFIRSQNPNEVRRVHRDILATYRDDINKYARTSKQIKVSKVFDRVPAFLGRKVKYSEFFPEYQSRDIREALMLLQQARVIHFCYHTSASGLPLESLKDENVFKIYFLDVGLYNTAMQVSWNQINESSEGDLLNKGIMCEQFVAIHLAYGSDGHEAPSLYYWLKDKSAHKAEIDFIIKTDEGAIVPVEVKAGSSGHLKALTSFVYEKKMKTAIRLDLKYRAKDVHENVTTPIRTKEGSADVEYRLLSFAVFQCGELSRFLKGPL
jgi:predicted AAA+ superfamily ATPase